MLRPKIYADFHNADAQGRLRLTCQGTIDDLLANKIVLRDGLLLTLYSDDLDDAGDLDQLIVEGVVSFSSDENCWLATIDWNAIKHSSDNSFLPIQGAAKNLSHDRQPLPN